MSSTTEWILVRHHPLQAGHYLVCHETTDHRKYRFVRYWTGQEWYNANEDKYGTITHWLVMPDFP